MKSLRNCLYIPLLFIVMLSLIPQSTDAQRRRSKGNPTFDSLVTDSLSLPKDSLLLDSLVVDTLKTDTTAKKKDAPDAESVVDWLHEMDIRIVPVSEKHLRTYATLPIQDDHRDPNDRLLIAQAITDRTALVSSDHKFAWYEKEGLEFIFNKR